MRLAREHIYSGTPSESVRDLPWATLRDLPGATLRDRRFKNDTERLEKLFELHTKMTAK